MKTYHEETLSIRGYDLNKIYMEDFLESAKKLPDNSFDLIVADPPYNLSKGNKLKLDNSFKLPGFGGNWNKTMEMWDNIPLWEYLNFSYAWLTQARRLIKPTGSIWVHGTYHNIGIINFLMQTIGIEIINEVIWYKRNSFPNLSGRRLTASHETILWANKGCKKREYFFDYQKSKEIYLKSDKMKQRGKQLRTVWDIPNNKKKEETKFGKHPTQKPLSLIERMISISAKKDQTCLIPFAGSGSEAVACIRLGLNFLGFEIEEKYFDIAVRRIEEEKSKKPGYVSDNNSKPTVLEFYSENYPEEIK